MPISRSGKIRAANRPRRGCGLPGKRGAAPRLSRRRIRIRNFQPGARGLPTPPGGITLRIRRRSRAERSGTFACLSRRTESRIGRLSAARIRRRDFRSAGTSAPSVHPQHLTKNERAHRYRSLRAGNRPLRSVLRPAVAGRFHFYFEKLSYLCANETRMRTTSRHDPNAVRSSSGKDGPGGNPGGGSRNIFVYKG